ncbi:MAG: flagellar basal body rod protein FlgB [Clostridium sp.]|uniref:flagellar basal body rod protein FlgB n=1 Tax=Clostridium sp. TaxID=1506 RepID=UPI0030217472
MTNNEIYSLIKKSMSVTVEGNKAIANNIANVNTKDYKRHYVPFEQVMEDTAKGGLKTNDRRHISTKNGEIQVKRDTNTSMRENGNNVDIESEMTSQAANTMMYESLVRFASGKLNSRSKVIKGGV